jgi:hypothetical protein
LIVANQFTTQLTQEIRDAVFGNMGTIVAFRVGQNDVESLGKYFQPAFDTEDLLRLPNYNTIVRTLIGGVPTQPFSMVTLPALGTPNPRLAEALKQLSAAKYGKPKGVVEKEINDRMATKPVAPAGGGFGATAGAGAPSSFGVPPSSQAPAQPSAGQGSFLDEWLAKKQQAPPASAATIQPAPAISSQFESKATPPPPPPDTTKNISSDEIQKEEVKKIANELKQELKDKDDTIFIDHEGTLKLADEAKKDKAKD